MITVSTSLVPPGPGYRLEAGPADSPTHVWTFAHPRYWLGKGVKADVGLDAGHQWGEGREAAKIAFWGKVADHVECWPDAGTFAGEVNKRQLRAEREKAEREAGHLDLW